MYMYIYLSIYTTYYINIYAYIMYILLDIYVIYYIYIKVKQTGSMPPWLLPICK